MLFKETISDSTLELLIQLQSQALLKNTRLVGGTSLALQIGHRISVDLDLFGEISLNDADIAYWSKSFRSFKQLYRTQNILISSISDIKVDLVNYSYPWLVDPVNIEGITLAGIQDIAAMKLAAITNRGSKKDFIDIFFLLKEFTLQEMIRFYEKKYHDGSVFMVIKSLSYYDDAEAEPMPKMLLEIDWDKVKGRIIHDVTLIS